MNNSELGGHKVLWLIVGPSAGLIVPAFFLNRLADQGVDVLPGTLVGAGIGTALIIFLRTSDRPKPETMLKARWRWGLFLLSPVAVLAGPPIEVVFLGALAAFLALFVILVGIGMFRDRFR